MALFDDISKTLADKGKEAAQKAKDVAGIVQLKAQVTSEKSKVKSLYGAIGQLYYKNHRDDADGEYQSIIDEITASLTKAADLQEQIRKLEGSTVCPSCGAVVKKGNRFCGKCGAEVPEEAEEPATAEEAETDEDEESIFEDEPSVQAGEPAGAEDAIEVVEDKAE